MASLPRLDKPQASPQNPLLRGEEAFMDFNDTLEDELGKYPNKWVAILEVERRIVAVGETAKQAQEEAEAKGYLEIALFKVPMPGKAYVY